ncbi:MAG: 23S rRNA (guanosine(2251)-2'-O)-methyltransferase RlmB [Actinomycetia bacterium]|nr:23S rRNA (guanosine(2251)-2'-O)-methyltransferase RlmB [Actinomycetes bacterium]
MTAPAEIVYGRQPVRALLQAGRRTMRELLATERALAAEAWLREAPGLRLQIARERHLTEACGSRDHQGVVARCDPYVYADAWELAGQASPLLVCLDGITDPQNFGAVCRSAEAAGASGIVIPERAAARVTSAVCKASAGAVEYLDVAVVVNLVRYLAEIKSSDLWIWAAAEDAETPYWSADLEGGVALVLGAEGRGLRPSARRVCDGAIAVPLAGCVESLNVSVAAGVILFEAARQRRHISAGEQR